ncbi:hypothetical protein [Vreelandella lutescens]|uniref:Uncharacterized protein n=1 Tax=Vreelandella lutescens TaxID=1602943 RepID=A0ABQ1NMI8_9GAMM|nr:hypothetical protein [Halomonas lutescens]GGC80831.1 hypothetical protein GCM10011382_08660 [Halomonas lutescens]
MKVIHIAAAVALALFSSMAMAERGSGEDNKISYPESTAQQQLNDTQYFSSSELQVLNQ